MASLKALLFLFVLRIAVLPNAVGQVKPDVVHGDLIQFNQNGAWCWYQDERVIVDTVNGRLVLGSEGSGAGLGGEARNGAVDAVIYDLASGASRRNTLRLSGSDDHNVPAFLMMPNGNYLTMYADHFDDYSRYRIFDGTYWSAESQFDWQLPGRRTYSNLFYLADEDVVYNFSRADRENPHIMVSHDYGETWRYHGLLAEPDEYIGYVNGYFKYWTNGQDRIDFVATEYHPRDFDTSLFHGYIQGGKTHNSFGELIDESIADRSAPRVTDFTPVFLTGTRINGELMTRIWDHDLVRYADGSIAALIKARSSDSDPANPSNDPEHVFFYSRFDGVEWKNTYLGRAGKKLYGSEQDYTGLGALDPDDPSTIYVSTTYDPRDDAFLGVHEIFRGVTADEGASWAWTPVTENSTRDNLRPIVPAWDEEHTALLWFRGTYFSAQRTDAAVVGIIQDATAKPAPRIFQDATAANTFLADGSGITPTGPSPVRGLADGRWHVRSGYGNGGSLLASAEISGEDAPLLKTELPDGLEIGIYDVWINFWGKPTADWRIRAGLSPDHLMIFRHMAAQTADAGAYSGELLTNQEDLHLYQAFVGRITKSVEGQVHYVYVDDHAVQTGTTSLIGDEARTWYDGVTYARSARDANGGAEDQSLPASVAMHQNYPNPFSSGTRILFEIPAPSTVRLEVFDSGGRLVRTLHRGALPAGTHARMFDAQGLSSGTYFYRMTVDGQSRVGSMTLIR